MKDDKMRKDIKTTEGIFPMPVLMVATYNEDGTVDVMNAAWGTMYERDQVALNLTETHKTVKNIKNRKAFTVLLPKVCLFLICIHRITINLCLCLKLLTRSILPSFQVFLLNLL